MNSKVYRIVARYILICDEKMTNELESVGSAELISEIMPLLNEIQNRGAKELDSVDIRRLHNMSQWIRNTINEWIIQQIEGSK